MTAKYQAHRFKVNKPMATTICTMAVIIPNVPYQILLLAKVAMASAPKSQPTIEVIPPMPNTRPLHTKESVPRIR